MAYDIPRKVMHQLVHAYWREHYRFLGMEEDEQCRLCGTAGMLPGATLHTLNSRVVQGVEQYCICPTGQALRRESVLKDYEES